MRILALLSKQRNYIYKNSENYPEDGIPPRRWVRRDQLTSLAGASALRITVNCVRYIPHAVEEGTLGRVRL